VKRTLLAVVGTVSGLVMLLSFKSHPAAVTSSTSGGAAPASSVPSSTGTPAAGGTRSGSSGSSQPTTVTGDAVDTRWGPVQVQAVLSGGKITKVTVLQAPHDNQRDQEINSFALPQLTQEALSAQSAHIDMVSGATYTSYGYIQSLQSALDKA
jgi:uncharacterized protein with FMN-binding domain